jgi:hypothetical protein
LNEVETKDEYDAKVSHLEYIIEKHLDFEGDAATAVVEIIRTVFPDATFEDAQGEGEVIDLVPLDEEDVEPEGR